MNFIDQLVARRYPKCGSVAPDCDSCDLEPGHWGFHKSARRAWPNAADSPESWAELGRRLLSEPQGTNGIPYLSYNEIVYALEAYKGKTPVAMRAAADKIDEAIG